jgi:Secretion system C-terminal sorting domain
MKKISGLVTLLLVGVNFYAQTETLNLKKYWQYREKFKKHFVFYSQSKGQFTATNPSGGGGLPANSINDFTVVNGGIGENPSCERGFTNTAADPNASMGSRKYGDMMANYDTYLGFLATEYKLLKNENADVSGVLSELYYALYAVDRLDKRSDAYLGQNPTAPDNADGFSTRDDVQSDLGDIFFSEYEYTNNPRDRYRCISSSANDIKGIWDTAADPNSQFNSSNFISRDQLIGLIFGLRFVHKFVDNIYVKPLTTDEGFFIIDKVKELADRLAMSIQTMRLVADPLLYKKTRNFLIFDPVQNKPAKFGDMSAASWPFLKTCEIITGNTYNKKFKLDYDWKLFNPVPPNTPILNNLVRFESDMGFIWNTVEGIDGYSIYNNTANISAAGGFIVSPGGFATNNYVFKSSPSWTTINQNLFSSVGNFLLTNPIASFGSFAAEKTEDFLNETSNQIFKPYNISMICGLASTSGIWNQNNMVNKWARIHDMHYIYDLAYTVLNNTTPILSQQDYITLLNSAPYSGPYNLNTIIYGPPKVLGALNHDPIWNSSNALENDKIPHVTTVEDFRGEYSGRDYMFLYNMYKLAFPNTGNLTYSKKCTKINTEFLTATNFNTTNGTVIANVNVNGKFIDYITKKIELEEQFNVNTTIPNTRTVTLSGQTATCEAGTILKVNTGAKLIVGLYNATTNKKRQGLLRIRPNTTLQIEANGELIVNDKDEVVVESGGKLVMSQNSIITLNNGKLTLKPGAQLIITPGAIFRLMGSNAIVDVKDPNFNLIIPTGTANTTFTKSTATVGGTFQWEGNLSWAASSTNKLAIDGVTLKCKGTVTYNNGNKLELSQSDACLDIAGSLNLGTNAKFTFTKGTATDGGYVKFSNPNANSNTSTILAAAGASMEFIGAGKTDKVIEVAQHWVLVPNTMASLKIQDGLVENTAATGFGELSVPCSLTVSNVKFMAMNAANTTSRGIELYGQYHSIDNSEFRNFTEGAVYYGDFNNNPLKITNSLFQANRVGIMGYKDGGLNLVGNTFTNNNKGVYMTNAILASNVQSNIFNNSVYQTKNGATHSEVIPDTTINGLQWINLWPRNGANRSHCAIKYKGASDLYLFNNQVKGLHTGVIADNNKLSLQCNTFTNMQSTNVDFKSGTLNMSAKTSNGGHNVLSGTGFALLRLLQMQQSNILLNSGFNSFNLTPNGLSSTWVYASIDSMRWRFDFSFYSQDMRFRTAPNNINTSTANAVNTISNKIQTLQKIDFPLLIHGTANSINPPQYSNADLYVNRNYWIPAISGAVAIPNAYLQDLNHLNTQQNQSFPDPYYTFTIKDINRITAVKECGDTSAPCVGSGCIATNRIAPVCATCSNVSTQELGVAQTNVAANNAMDKMEDLNVVNRYKKSLSIFNDVESNATSLQNIGDPEVIQYVHEGTITALSEGLRKKQIVKTNAQDKAKLQSLENAYGAQITAISALSYDKKMEKLNLYKAKAHVQHLQDKSNLAMATIAQTIAYVQADAQLSADVSIKSLMKDKCFYDLSHQYNIGTLQKEQFSTALKACQASIDSTAGLFRTNGSDAEDDNQVFEITEEMRNAATEWPIIKEPPYRSYVDEDKQGYMNEYREITSLITVMPNPAQNRISILAKASFGVCTISFTDMNGRTVISKTITLNQNEPITIDLNLNNGIYLYTISNVNGTIDKNKLVVLNQE